MILPNEVRAAIEEHAAAVGLTALKQAVQAMSQAYRRATLDELASLPPDVRAAAYLATRMPATYAASVAGLRELQGLPIASVLDVGAGAGAAALAARRWFPSASISLIERDASLAGIAAEVLPRARILRENFLKIAAFPPHDLVVAAYSLGEAPQSGLILRLWQAARVALVLIEPGTTAGFSFVREARSQLLAAGAHMVAPCPHTDPCPLPSPDWCHFAARVERSSLHRRLKDGALSYEDEKFSYVAVARETIAPATARIIRRPQHQPRLITIETCTPGGIHTQRISKRDAVLFRAARQAGWGDAFPSL